LRKKNAPQSIFFEKTINPTREGAKREFGAFLTQERQIGKSKQKTQKKNKKEQKRKKSLQFWKRRAIRACGRVYY